MYEPLGFLHVSSEKSTICFHIAQSRLKYFVNTFSVLNEERNCAVVHLFAQLLSTLVILVINNSTFFLLHSSFIQNNKCFSVVNCQYQSMVYRMHTAHPLWNECIPNNLTFLENVFHISHQHINHISHINRCFKWFIAVDSTVYIVVEQILEEKKRRVFCWKF